MIQARKPFAQQVRLWGSIAGLIIATSTAAASEPLATKVIMRSSPKIVQAIEFTDGEGKPRSLSDFRGKIVLLNIWATWCVPCRKEMPALDHLQAALGGPEFQVLPLSIDRGGIDVVRKFFTEIGIKKLGLYLDQSSEAAGKLGIVGLPTTLILDRSGREIGRLIGPAEWDEPENIQFIKCIVANGGSATETQKNAGAAATTACGGRIVHFPVDDANRK